MFMNDMADTYPVDSALFGAEDPNAADSLVDSDAEGEDGDDGEGDSNDDASSDSDDSDSSTSGVAGANDSKKTGTTDTFVGSSSGTYHKGDEVPAPSQPSEARKATTPVKGAKKPAKIPVAQPAKASPGNSTMGGAGSRPPRRKSGSKSASILASSPHFIPSGTDTVVDDAPEPLQPDEASKAAKQVKASGASAAVAAFPMMSLSKAAPGGGGDGYEKEIAAADDEEVVSTLLCIHLTLYRHHQYSLFELSSIHAKSVCYDAFWIILGIIQKVLVWTFSECKHLCELPASHIAFAPPSPTSSFLA